MVKKVIDIIPPRQKPEGRAMGMPLPSPAPDPEPGMPFLAQIPLAEQEVKPKIVFNNKNYEREQEREEIFKPEGGGFFKGLPLKIGVFIAVILAGMYFWDAKFAQAVIKIWPETSVLSHETRVAIDLSVGQIDLARGTIPGFTITAEKIVAGDAPATGTKSAQGRARGAVKIFNNYTNPQTLVKNTRLQAPLEKFQPALEGDESPWFRTTESIVLPAKSSAVAQVVADGAGEKYNIEPSVFSVPGLAGTAQYTFVYAQSFEKFTGGSLDSAPEVTQEDLKNAKTEIENRAKEEIKKELVAKAKEQGLEIADESAIKFELGDPEIAAKVGDNIARIGGQINAKASVVAYKKSDLDVLGKEFVLSKLAEGSLIDENSLNFESSYAGVDEAGSMLSLDLSMRAMVYLGMIPENLKKGLSEKKAEEAELFLMNQPGTKQVEVRLSPPWRFSVPRDLDRIEIKTILE